MGDTTDQMHKDSDMIFTQISTSGAIDFKDARNMIVMLYVPDMTISRAGISHAMKRLERFYLENDGTTVMVAP